MNSFIRSLETHALLPGPWAAWLIRHGSLTDGYDPIPGETARHYAQGEWGKFDPAAVDALEQRIGGFAGKRVLDLGAGPGQYAIEFARRGAQVTWHDISRNYLEIAREHARERGLELDFSLGYLEEADRFLATPFDFVFNRICWFYCVDDANFARLFHGLIRPGGSGFIDNFINPKGFKGKARFWVNAWTGLKIGHPPPPPGRLERLFRRFGDLEVAAATLSPRKEQLFLTRRSA